MAETHAGCKEHTEGRNFTKWGQNDCVPKRLQSEDLDKFSILNRNFYG